MSPIDRSHGHVPKSLADHNFVTKTAQDMVKMTAISYIVNNQLANSKGEATNLVEKSDGKLTVCPEGAYTVRRIVQVSSSKNILVTGKFVVGKTARCTPINITVEER